MADFKPCLLHFAVASRNNDRTVAGKSFAWRLLGLMPSISKAATVLQTDEWRSERRARLYHSCIDILAEQINDLTGRDIYFRYGDQQFRRSRVFLDFLCMDGDEVSSATLCPTTQCTSCWCPKGQLSDPDIVFPFRDTTDVRERVAAAHKDLLDRDGRPRDRCKERVLLCMSYDMFMTYIISSYSRPMLCAGTCSRDRAETQAFPA